MRHWRTWAAVAACCLPGCLRFCHPIYPPPPDEVSVSLSLPRCQKNRVYVFFLHGCDPLDYGNLAGLRDYAQSLGYIKTYYGGSYHAFHFADELRRLRKEQPDARFVVVGFAHGAGLARDVACAVASDGVFVDLAVYLAGDERGRPLHKPANVAKVLSVLAGGAEVKDAENHRLDDIGRHAVPTDKRTLALLARELGEVARQVPIVTKLPPTVAPVGPTLPPPREEPRARGEWDFLQPDGLAVGAQNLPPTDQALAGPPSTVPKKWR